MSGANQEAIYQQTAMVAEVAALGKSIVDELEANPGASELFGHSRYLPPAYDTHIPVTFMVSRHGLPQHEYYSVVLYRDHFRPYRGNYRGLRWEARTRNGIVQPGSIEAIRLVEGVFYSHPAQPEEVQSFASLDFNEAQYFDPDIERLSVGRDGSVSTVRRQPMRVALVAGRLLLPFVRR